MIKMKKSKLYTLLICTIIISLLAAGCGAFLVMKYTGMTVVNKDTYDNMVKKYSKLYQIQESINDKFLWETDDEKQMNAVYKALVDSLGDKYSGYLTKEECEKFMEYAEGTFTGVGIVFSQDKKGSKPVVNKVIKSSPAEAAGIKAGDVLLKVNGKEYKDIEKYSEKIRGETGTSVKITYRHGKEVKTVSVVRAEIEEPSVGTAMIDKKYGYIRIGGFEKGTGEQFKTELAEMENKKVKGIVIDLRMNAGGMVNSAVDIADTLLPECTIVQTVNNKDKKQNYNSDENCTKLKYVVLVDEGTASASEILAAAIQDNKAAKIVGTTTFGKGIIQELYSMQDGSAIKLTTMEYLSPKGHHIHKVGVKPDYVVKRGKNDKKDIQLEKAISVLKKNN